MIIEYVMSPHLVGHIELRKMAWIPFDVWDEARGLDMDIPPIFGSKGGKVLVYADAKEFSAFVDYVEASE